MNEIVGDIWTFHDGNFIVIPTNGDWNRRGDAVMGRGLALQAATRFPHLPQQLGDSLKSFGNHVHLFGDFRIITFPVKHHWHDNANIKLIEASSRELKLMIKMIVDLGFTGTIYMPHVGCGYGRLSWPIVKPVVERNLGDLKNITVCDNSLDNRC